MNVKIDGQFESWVAPNFRWCRSCEISQFSARNICCYFLLIFLPTWRCLTRGWPSPSSSSWSSSSSFLILVPPARPPHYHYRNRHPHHMLEHHWITRPRHSAKCYRCHRWTQDGYHCLTSDPFTNWHLGWTLAAAASSELRSPVPSGVVLNLAPGTKAAIRFRTTWPPTA